MNKLSNNEDLNISELIDNKEIVQQASNYNVITGGDNNYLIYRLNQSIRKAKQIDIIVSFLMESGVNAIINDLNEAVQKNVPIRILTGSYLNITQPSALCQLKRYFGDKIDLRFYNDKHRSFHPKAYIFKNDENNEIYIGSSNISRGALTNSIEWNYRFVESQNPNDYSLFNKEFEDLFYNHSIVITDEVLKSYSKNWRKPAIFKDIISDSEEEDKLTAENNIKSLFEPRGAQIEALYALEKSREEGFDKGLVVLATGVGKTYLSAFDSINSKRILFVAHRQEIIRQAAQSFKNVRNSDDIGFFYNDIKDTDKSMIFALVQTLGKDQYLNEKYFKKDYFDYIVIDEFHHAVSGNYQKIINYFNPKFMLGLTATPERLDSKDVFALCDYNTVYEVRLADAINRGYLVPFRYYGIFDETVDYDNVKFINGKYDNTELEEALMLNKRAELILNHYGKYNSERALGFCTSRKHAEYMAEYFSEHGVESAAVYSGSNGEYAKDRSEAIKNLIQGKLKVIFSVDMFNEGLDIPSIDMVMFLRPTQSPTVFLQQLGRGLRLYNDKKYLNVLDFIGNYKKADLIPFLLSGKEYSVVGSKRGAIKEEDYPEDCRIDFDFRVIDLFKQLASKEMKLKDLIVEEYFRVKVYLGHRPTRVELFNNMDDSLYSSIKSNSKLNFFKDYLEFLNEHDELTEDEKVLYNSIGHDFIKMIENTSMSKTYKIPVIYAFYNHGNVKMAIDEDDIYEAFYEFYNKASNKVDMLRDKSTSNFEKWNKDDYVKLAKKNPVKFLLKSESQCFKEKDGYILALYDEMKEIIESKAFKEQMIDALECRTKRYYDSRNLNDL